ncbi:UNVERIFIED_CONTAM: hypothetical protein FKN15_034236 [Acipenser sinensis]
MFILFKVINAYITALVRRFNLEGDEKAFLIESFTMSKIWRGSYQTLRKFDPSKYSLILGIINEHHHWTLAINGLASTGSYVQRGQKDKAASQSLFTASYVY